MKEEKPKGTFYLFRTPREDGKGFYYIQHLVSASHDDGLSNTCWPEYAWRGRTYFDVVQMQFLISISGYKDKNWELVEYEMEMDTPSWAKQPTPREYKNILSEKIDESSLSGRYKEEFEKFKIKAMERYGRKG